MRWTRGDRSINLEDRRDESVGGRVGLPGGAKLGIGGTLVLLALSFIFKRDFFSAVVGTDSPQSDPRPAVHSPQEDELVDFVSFVLDDVQKTWAQEFAKPGKPYTPAKLVLFREAVRSGCGVAESAMGPFYCPVDQKVYIDLGFYQDLKARFGAPGDFAQAYVIAHEMGHHVQNLLGIEKEVRQAQRAHSAETNALSVRMELQADCFAGVWGHSTSQRKILEQGDIEEGLGAAAAVGDDRLQKQATGTVNPEGFTHGSSGQRVRWFKAGFAGGSIADCDTFRAGP